MIKSIPAIEFCNKIFDGTHDTPKPSEQGYPLVTSKHIVNSYLDDSSAYLISDEDYNSINKRSKVSQWDILFSMIGTVGETYLERKTEINYAIKNLGVFSCKDERKAKWLYYFLQTPIAHNHIRRYLNGAVQKFLPLGALREFPVIPFDNEKYPLIELMDRIDRKIALNQQINQKLEAMAKQLYDYWFVQFDFPDENGKPYKSSGGEMVWCEVLKREVPKGWEVVSFSKFINLERGITYDKKDISDSGLAILRATNINGNSLNLNDLVYISKNDISDNQLIKKFDTLIVMSSGSKEHIGKNAIYYFNDKTGFGAFCSKITPKEYLIFVNVFLQSDIFKKYIKTQCLGTNINNLTNGIILNCPIIEAPKVVIDKFEDLLKSNYEKIASNTIETQKLTQLRDFLLPMLMNGQVSVK